jgi:hypothetical protein
VHGERKGSTFRVVDFYSADRQGDVFEDFIAKYGIPSSKFRGCTRGMKERPIEAYAKSIGWKPGRDYDTAIGIRTDEIDRVSPTAEKRRLVYPLVATCPMTKPQINAWWDEQPFRLRLKGYQGNCAWCWKKSDRKLFTLIQEDPWIFDFPRAMEERYAQHGPEFRKTDWTPPPDYRRVFFRESRSVDDLFEQARELGNDFKPAYDDHIVFDPNYDIGAGCEESCEVFGEDADLPDDEQED